ncbi:MAG: mandelate racemase [Anaerolineae bacterium]|nr:mandelate racemase [Anaerolineae bacterium]
MDNQRIVRIEWARLEGMRPRKAGCNARLGEHGQQVSPPIARLTTNDGATGFGWSWLTDVQASDLIGFSLGEIVDENGVVRERFRALDYALYDLAAKLAGKPVYGLLGGQPDAAGQFRVACYDTSLYMDDLHLEDDDAAAALIASEARDGFDRGHRAFKLKVGRGAMHMPLAAGTRRDVAVIKAVREAIGPGARLMIDANNGYNVNLAKQVLGETAGSNVYWIEEAFHEDARLYGHLQDWLEAEGLNTLIADGEGDASRHLLDWAMQGIVDVVQYDVFRPGFSRWVELGPQIDAAGVRSGPHHYGEPYGNYAACHLAAAIEKLEGVEWDEAAVPGLDASAYTIVEGMVNVPALPGFGLALDEQVYEKAVRERGFVIEEGRNVK